MNKNIHTCLIIGSGPSGYTAGIYATRAGLNPILYTGLYPGGQLITTTIVENFPGYKNGVNGPQMMMDLEYQAKRFGCQVIYKTIDKVKFSPKIGGIHKVYSDGKEILTKSVIISTGASPKYLGIKEEKKYIGKGISTCATCDGFFYKNQSVIVVGGGDTAIEEAIYLSKICSKVTILVRKNQLKASKMMQERAINNSKISILFCHELKNIKDKNGVVETAVILNNVKKETFNMKIDAIFIAIGHNPNTSIFYELEKDNNGYLITKNKSTQTNFPGIFAAGDVQDSVYRQAITAAATGCIAALEAEKYISSIN